GRIFFANAERLSEKIRPLVAEAKPKVVALDLSGVFDLEYTALKMLTEAEERQRATGVLLWLVGLSPGVLAMVQRSPLGETLGRYRSRRRPHGPPRPLPRSCPGRSTSRP